MSLSFIQNSLERVFIYIRASGLINSYTFRPRRYTQGVRLRWIIVRAPQAWFLASGALGLRLGTLGLGRSLTD